MKIYIPNIRTYQDFHVITLKNVITKKGQCDFQSLFFLISHYLLRKISFKNRTGRFLLLHLVSLALLI